MLRLVLLQGSLCLLLGGMLALAGLVRRYALPLRVELAEPRPFGELHLAPPRRWIERHAEGGLSFEEPPGRLSAGRKLHIHTGRTELFVSPLDYLIRQGHLREPTEAGAEEHAGHVKNIRIAGWPGVLITQSRLLRIGEHHQPVAWKQVLACALLPTGQTIVLRLEGEGQPDSSDQDLLRRLGQSLAFVNQATGRQGGEIVLPQDIRLRLPANLASAEADDKFRVGRILLDMEHPSWLGIELTSCWLLPEDKPEMLASLLLWRDPRCRPGPVRQVDEHTWTCSARRPGLAPAVAYLRLNADGRALLAEFRGVSTAPEAPSAIAHLWQRLSEGLIFDELTPPQRFPLELSLERRTPLWRGRAALADLPADRSQLLAGHSLSQDWQWYHESSPRQSLMHVQYGLDARFLSALYDIDSAPPLGSGGSEVCRWRLDLHSAHYDYSLYRTGQGPLLSQKTQLALGKLRSTVLDEQKVLGRWTHGGSDLFIPGGLLPLALGRLPFEPLVLRTESLLNPAGQSAPAPLTLLLEPSTELPKFLPLREQPMRCWAIHVSGASHRSFWYLDDHARLHSIAFPSGIHLHRLDDEEGGKN